MKRRLIIGLLIALVISARAQDNSGPQHSSETVAAGAPSESNITSNSQAGSEDPLGPSDALSKYQQEMQIAFSKTCEDLEQIAQLASNGSINRQQAEYLTAERYQLGLMRFQFLRTLYRIVESDLQRGITAKDSAELQVFGGRVAGTAPASQLDPSQQMARYLGLNEVQVAAMRTEAAGDRKEVQRLIGQVLQNQRALTSATLRGQYDEKQVRVLAGKQSVLVKQLIVANARLEAKLCGMLTAEQQRRFDELQEAAIASATH